MNKNQQQLSVYAREFKINSFVMFEDLDEKLIGHILAVDFKREQVLVQYHEVRWAGDGTEFHIPSSKWVDFNAVQRVDKD